MEYKVVLVTAPMGFLGPKVQDTAERLETEVRELIAQGWEPQGGVSMGHTWAGKAPCLCQAMVRRR